MNSKSITRAINIFVLIAVFSLIACSKRSAAPPKSSVSKSSTPSPTPSPAHPAGQPKQGDVVSQDKTSPSNSQPNPKIQFLKTACFGRIICGIDTFKDGYCERMDWEWNSTKLKIQGPLREISAGDGYNLNTVTFEREDLAPDTSKVEKKATWERQTCNVFKDGSGRCAMQMRDQDDVVLTIPSSAGLIDAAVGRRTFFWSAQKIYEVAFNWSSKKYGIRELGIPGVKKIVTPSLHIESPGTSIYPVAYILFNDGGVELLPIRYDENHPSLWSFSSEALYQPIPEFQKGGDFLEFGRGKFLDIASNDNFASYETPQAKLCLVDGSGRLFRYSSASSTQNESLTQVMDLGR